MTKKTKFSQKKKNKVIELYLDSKNYTYREIAKITKISEGSVGTILTISKTPRRKPKAFSIGFPQRTKDPNDSATWKQGFYHMNLKFKKQ
tara:strand:- start:581 stop:850 length:270 start_codon:yes stop_codon:yes gene_type:complete